MKNSALVTHGQQHNSLRPHINGKNPSCYTGTVLYYCGISPANGVVYRITAEPVGAEIGNPPELWMYQSSWLRDEEVKRAKKALAHPTKENRAFLPHARDIIKEDKKIRAAFKAATKEYYLWLGKRQFKAKS